MIKTLGISSITKSSHRGYTATLSLHLYSAIAVASTTLDGELILRTNQLAYLKMTAIYEMVPRFHSTTNCDINITYKGDWYD